MYILLVTEEQFHSNNLLMKFKNKPSWHCLNKLLFKPRGWYESQPEQCTLKYWRVKEGLKGFYTESKNEFQITSLMKPKQLHQALFIIF